MGICSDFKRSIERELRVYLVVLHRKSILLASG